jgi:hypothetical protein
MAVDHRYKSMYKHFNCLLTVNHRYKSMHKHFYCLVTGASAVLAYAAIAAWCPLTCRLW